MRAITDRTRDDSENNYELCGGLGREFVNFDYIETLCADRAARRLPPSARVRAKGVAAPSTGAGRSSEPQRTSGLTRAALPAAALRYTNGYG
ncbi:hypothetical protein [Cellulomonas sp. 73-145]|uniref:hypothetical protein n=1 Tax=Cellulomonas sp. 73-145 TaxID=1895739 RepID=UPI0025BD4032|nr:hypothetical protein [Cellulomonas sp. 73-145]